MHVETRGADEPSREALIAELERRERQLAEAQAIAHVGSWEFDADEGSLRWSDELFRVLGFEPGEIEPRSETLFDRIHPDDRALVDAAYAAMGTSGAPMDFDVRLAPRVGQPIRWVRVRGMATLDGDRVVRAAGTVQDITETKESEQRLAFLGEMAVVANEAPTLRDAMVTASDSVRPFTRWRAVLATAPVPGSPGEFVHFESGWREHSPEELEFGRALGAEVVATGRMVQRMAPTGTIWVAGPTMFRDRVACAVVSDSLSAEEPRAYSMGIFTQMLATLSTVAQREQASAELAAARDEALAASRAKSEFLATMSHEIRTPLNGVIGLTELLLHTELTAHQRRLADGVDQAGRALLGLVNDILDLSKIEAGRLDLEEIDFVPMEVVERSVALFAEAAAAKGVRLAVAEPVDVPGLVRGDAVRLGQVVTNLVSNAVKFTDRGRVVVHVSATGASDLRVEVTDTGIGIDPAVQSTVFSAFSQADSSTTRRFGGTGLGLAISKRLVEAMGGSIGVRSRPGVGSTFWFTAAFLPPAPEEGAVPEREGFPVVAGLPAHAGGTDRGRILVVEDNEVNQLVATGMLEHLGFEPVVATDGERAVATLAADPDGFAAVLMDCQMPVLDGYDATRAIRALDGVAGQVPVIAMTASATAAERARCREAGMDDFLAKPVDPVLLEGALARWTDGTGRGSGAADRLQELLDDGFDPALVRTVVDRFGVTATESLDGVRAAVRSGDAHEAAERVHRLRGAAQNLGLSRVSEVCGEIEEAARAGELPDVPALERLRAEADVAVAELARAGAWL